MQVTEVANEGLKRAYTVTVPAGQIAATRDKRLQALAKDLRIPGFRPGKVPVSVVKQRYGAAVMGEVLEQSVNEATRQVVTDRGLKPALQPKIEVVNFAEGTDLEFRMDLEVLPEVPMPEFSGIELERLKAEPGEEQIAKALEAVAQRNRTLEDVAEARPAQKGEVLVCDFTGRKVPNLLRNPGAEGAGIGEPGTLPRHWAASVPEGLAHAVAGTGVEGGLPYVDVRLHGTAPQGKAATIFFDNVLPAKTGETYTLSAPFRVVAGNLPADARTALQLNERSDADFLRSNRADVAVPATGERAAATFTLSGGDAVAGMRPMLLVVFGSEGPVDVTLRIGPPSLVAGDVAEPEGETFQGGSATDMPIEVGGGGFIPGFTEQIEGLTPGETRRITVFFPLEYGAADLAGRQASFEVTAKALKRAVAPVVDDELAKSLGFTDLAALKDQLRQQVQREYDSLSRLRLKRALLDKLSERADFKVPEGMVDAEFGQIWQRVEADLKAGRLDDDDKGKDEATLKSEYRAIAERRIRLGLLLSEIGRTNNIQVSPDELSRAMRQEAARYPGQEQQVMEFFRRNPQSVESLRAPIFEEKVVDFILELAKVTDRQVQPEELTAVG